MADLRVRKIKSLPYGCAAQARPRGGTPAVWMARRGRRAPRVGRYAGKRATTGRPYRRRAGSYPRAPSLAPLGQFTLSRPTSSAQAADRSLPRKRESSFPPLCLLLPTRPAAQPLGSRGGPMKRAGLLSYPHRRRAGPPRPWGVRQRERGRIISAPTPPPVPAGWRLKWRPRPRPGRRARCSRRRRRGRRPPAGRTPTRR